MRIMGMSYVGGGSVSPGVAEELNGRTLIDPGAMWTNTGLTNANGQPLIIQVLPTANQALQEFIVDNYNTATPGQIPSPYAYRPTPVPTDIRGTVADIASGVSTGMGRLGAVAAAQAAAVPSTPQTAIPKATLAGEASLFTVIGMGANVVEQIARPNVGQTFVSGTTGLIADGLSNRIPGFSPAFNEAENAFNNSSIGKGVQNSINDQWVKFIDYWGFK